MLIIRELRYTGRSEMRLAIVKMSLNSSGRSQKKNAVQPLYYLRRRCKVVIICPTEEEKTAASIMHVGCSHLLMLSLTCAGILCHAFVQTVPPCSCHDVTAITMIPLWQPYYETTSLTFSAYPSTQRSIVIPNYKLSETSAFKVLRREPVSELKDLKDLEDSRLALCEEKGIFWEQCFIYGQSKGEPNHPSEKIMPPTW